MSQCKTKLSTTTLNSFTPSESTSNSFIITEIPYRNFSCLDGGDVKLWDLHYQTCPLCRSLATFIKEPWSDQKHLETSMPNTNAVDRFAFCWLSHFHQTQTHLWIVQSTRFHVKSLRPFSLLVMKVCSECMDDVQKKKQSSKWLQMMMKQTFVYNALQESPQVAFLFSAQQKN